MPGVECGRYLSIWLRLRTAVRTFRSIVDDCVLFLEVFAEQNKPKDAKADDWAGILC